MIQLSRPQSAALRNWFLPDKPGALVGLHVLQTGRGSFAVDRWPNPRCLLAETGGNYALAGDALSITAEDLRGRITGVVEAPPWFLPLLQETFPDLKIWDRVILSLETLLPSNIPSRFPLRRLTQGDSQALSELSEEVSWISKTWGGPEGLVRSGYAWGVVDEGRIVSLACTFFVGETYEDIGVVTEPEYRRQGLSLTCLRALCEDIFSRGRRASWSTSPDNKASLGVAQKLGFEFDRYDTLYVINQPIPDSPAS